MCRASESAGGAQPPARKPAASRNERTLGFLFSEVELVRQLGLELVQWDEQSARVRMPFGP